MLNDAFLNRLDTLRLTLKNPANGGAGGVRRSRSLGSSAEFSDFREYAPGDDIRRLDWNAYARFDKLFMKLFMEEQEAVVTILLDGSASMQAKRSEAIQAAEALSYLALIGGDRLRIAWIRDGNPSVSSYMSGRRAYQQASEFLNCSEMGGATQCLEGIRNIDPFPKGMCFLISDCYFDEGIDSTLDYLRYRRQETALVHVLSPFEMKPDLEGAVKLKDAESAPDIDLFIDGAALRQYQAALDAFLKDIREQCCKRGVPYMLLWGERPFEESFIPALARGGMLT